MTSEQASPCSTQTETLDLIAEAWDSGQGIVPLAGAGISIESGIPSISQLVTYLAKVEYFIRENKYLPPSHQSLGLDSPSASLIRYYKDDPSRYIRDFGWPDSSQLTSDLWQCFENDGNDKPDAMSDMVQGQLIKMLSRLESDFAGANLIEIVPAKSDRNRPVRLRGDWKTLLGDLTSGNPEYSDTLFQHLIARRSPGLSHRSLAFLSSLMNWQLLLTINFDTLIEDALRLEGRNPVVYDISQDSLPPNASLVKRQLSVVKLHGGAYGLRVGERLDYPLDQESRTRIRRYLPADPLLLVMGCSGDDRRVMDLVESVAAIEAEHHGTRRLRVVWLHFESPLPEKLKELKKRWGDVIHTERVEHPGAFLYELYCRVARTHPVSSVPYTATSQRPISAQSSPVSNYINGNPTASPNIFDNSKNSPKNGLYPVLATQRMHAFVSKHTASHIPIWIDVATIDTVGGLVSAILRECRRHDPLLPHVILPTGRVPEKKSSGMLDKALRHVRTALRRGRYIVALDGIEHFGRPQTVHHGIPLSAARSTPGVAGALPNVKDFHLFLEELISTPNELRDSLLCMAIDKPATRFDDRKSEGDNLIEQIFNQIGSFQKRLSNLNKFKHVEVDRPSASMYRPLPSVIAKEGQLSAISISYPNIGSGCSLSSQMTPQRMEFFLFVLSVFRRPRSIVAIHRICANLVSATSTVQKLDEVLRDLQSAGVLYRIEGGFYWMDQRFRNDLYHSFTEATHTGDVAKLVNRKRFGEKGKASLAQCFSRLLCMGSSHYSAAQYYYTDAFLASGDSVAFLESLYHQISAARSLTKAVALSAIYQDLVDEVIQTESESLLSFCKLVSPEFVGSIIEDLGALNHGKLHEWRITLINGLLGTLRRHRAFLLSQIDGDTLLAWIEWILRDDLGRLGIEFYVGKKKLSASAVAKDQEHFATQTLTELTEELKDLRALLLRDRTDLPACIDQRIAQLKENFPKVKILGVETPTLERTKCFVDEISKNELFKKEYESLLKNEPPTGNKVLDRMIDISSCMKMMMPTETEKVLSIVHDGIKIQAELRTNQAATKQHVKYLFRKADSLITGINPWFLKGAMVKSTDKGGTAMPNQKNQQRCEDAIKICTDGLEMLYKSELHSTEHFVRYRCFFRSIRGRASYLLGDYEKAYPELESAVAGLEADRGSDRVAIAVATMYLAECLMLRANHTVHSFCDDRLGSQKNLWRNLSTEGRYALWHPEISGQINGEIAKMKGLDKDAEELFRQTLYWWVQKAIPGRSGFREQRVYSLCRARLESSINNRGVANRCRKALDAWESLISDEYSKTMFKGLEAKHGGSDIVDRLLDQSLSHWSSELLDSFDGPEYTIIRHGIGRKAARRLIKAGGLLERSRELLSYGRRNAYWWHYLYQLTAQLDVERLLHLSTFSAEGTKDADDRHQLESTSHVFGIGFVGILKDGLRAVRYGLDHVLVEARSDSQDNWKPHSMEAWLMRLWLELMTAGFIFASMRENTHVEQYVSHEDPLQLFKAWDWYNQSVGIQKFPKTEDECLRTLGRSGVSHKPSLVARGHTLASIKELMQLGALGWLKRERDRS